MQALRLIHSSKDERFLSLLSMHDEGIAMDVCAQIDKHMGSCAQCRKSSGPSILFHSLLNFLFSDTFRTGKIGVP